MLVAQWRVLCIKILYYHAYWGCRLLGHWVQLQQIPLRSNKLPLCADPPTEIGGSVGMFLDFLYWQCGTRYSKRGCEGHTCDTTTRPRILLAACYDGEGNCTGLNCKKSYHNHVTKLHGVRTSTILSKIQIQKERDQHFIFIWQFSNIKNGSALPAKHKYNTSYAGSSSRVLHHPNIARWSESLRGSFSCCREMKCCVTMHLKNASTNQLALPTKCPNPQPRATTTRTQMPETWRCLLG
jgi:hypothetical protein